MSANFNFYVKSAKRRLPYFENYRKTAEHVKEIVKKRYPEARLYVFGSTVKNVYTAASDIDMLVVLDHIPSLDERAKLRAEVFLTMPDAPVELHITDSREFERWYLRFVKPSELIEI